MTSGFITLFMFSASCELYVAYCSELSSVLAEQNGIPGSKHHRHVNRFYFWRSLSPSRKAFCVLETRKKHKLNQMNSSLKNPKRQNNLTQLTNVSFLDTFHIQRVSL